MNFLLFGVISLCMCVYSIIYIPVFHDHSYFHITHNFLQWCFDNAIIPSYDIRVARDMVLNPQSWATSPLAIVSYFISSKEAYFLTSALFYFLGGIGMYFTCRRFGIRPGNANIAALAWILTPYLWSNTLYYQSAFTMFPLLSWCLYASRMTNSYDVIIISSFLSISCMFGQPYCLFMGTGGFLTGFFLLWNSNGLTSKRSFNIPYLIYALCFIAFSLCLSRLILSSIVCGKPLPISESVFNFRDILTLFFSVPGMTNTSNFYNFPPHELMLYIGISALMVFLSGCFYKKNKKVFVASILWFISVAGFLYPFDLFGILTLNGLLGHHVGLRSMPLAQCFFIIAIAYSLDIFTKFKTIFSSIFILERLFIIILFAFFVRYHESDKYLMNCSNDYYITEKPYEPMHRGRYAEDWSIISSKIIPYSVSWKKPVTSVFWSDKSITSSEISLEGSFFIKTEPMAVISSVFLDSTSWKMVTGSVIENGPAQSVFIADKNGFVNGHRSSKLWFTYVTLHGLAMILLGISWFISRRISISRCN